MSTKKDILLMGFKRFSTWITTLIDFGYWLIVIGKKLNDDISNLSAFK